MLGNHVNVSARNKKLIHKILCAFLAVVLLGLMIPHGITASLNAYAEGENAAEQPAADNPVAPEEESTPSEEVNSEDPAPIAGPVLNDPVPNASCVITVNAGDGYFNSEKRNPDEWASLGVTFLEQIETTTNYKKAQFTFSWDSGTKTYQDVDDKAKDLLQDESDSMLHFATVAPTDTNCEGFWIGGDDITSQTTQLEDNQPYTVNAVYSVDSLIVQNPYDGTYDSAKLTCDDKEITITSATHRWILSGASLGEEKYLKIKYGSQYTNDKQNKELIIKDISNVSHTIKITDTSFNEFTIDEAHDSHIDINMVFNATYDESALVTLKTNLGNSLPADIGFYKQVNGQMVKQTALPEPFSVTDTKFKGATVEGYDGAFNIGADLYAFKIETEGNYQFENIKYTMGSKTNADLPTEETDITEDLTIKASYKVKVTFTYDNTKGTVKDSDGNTVASGTSFFYRPGSEIEWADDTDVLTIDETIQGIPNEHKFTPEGIYPNLIIIWSSNGTDLDEAVATSPMTIRAEFKTGSGAWFQKGEQPDYVKIYKNDSQTELNLDLFNPYNNGDTFKVENGVLIITKSDGIEDKYTAKGDGHLVAFDKWTDENGVEITTGTFGNDDVKTFVANGYVLDKLTATWKIDAENPEDANVRIDIMFGDTLYISVAPAYDATTKSFKITALPQDINLIIYVESAGCQAFKSSPQHLDSESKDLGTFNLTPSYSYSHDGVDIAQYKWADDVYKTKTFEFDPDKAAIADKGEYLNFPQGARFSIDAVPGDTIYFCNLHKDFTGQGNIGVEGSWRGIYIAGQRILKITLSDSEVSSGKAYFNIWYQCDFDFISINTVPRTVKFGKDTHLGTGKFYEGSTEIDKLTDIEMGDYCIADVADDPSILHFYSENGTTPKHTIKATPDSGSLCKGWDGVSEKLHIFVNNTTITAKFVKEYITVSFAKQVDDPPTTYKTAASIKLGTEDITSTTVYNGSKATSVYGKGVSTITFGGVEADKTVTVTANSTDKFVLDKPFDWDESKKIDETYESGLTIHYQIIERGKITVTFKTGDDIVGYSETTTGDPTAVEATEGGGAWTPSTETVPHTYTNTFYEDTPYGTILGKWAGVSFDKEFYFWKGTVNYLEGWDPNTTDTKLTTATTFTAQYTKAAWVKGSALENKTGGTKITTINGYATLTSESAIDPTHAAGSFIQGTFTSGDYALKVYDGITVKMVAGGNGYIECQEVTLTGVTGTVTNDFKLDKGYTWFAADWSGTLGTYWVSKYDNDKQIDMKGGISKTNNLVVMPQGTDIKFNTDSRLQMCPGDEIQFDTVDSSGTLVASTWDGSESFAEDVSIVNNSLDYTIWKRSAEVEIANSKESAPDVKISRIDYYIPWDSYVSISGKVTEEGSGNALENIDVYYLPNPASYSTKTNASGQYYIIFPASLKDGYVYFVDNDNPSGDSDHLDERKALTGADIEYSPAMIPAVHITGHIDYQRLNGDIVNAKGAVVSYTFDKNAEAPALPDGWDTTSNLTHGYAYADDDGNFSYKVKKGEDFSKGWIWYTYNDPVEGDAAIDGRAVGSSWDAQSDLSNMGPVDGKPLRKAGGAIEVSGEGEGNAGFELIYYYYGSQMGQPETYTPDQTIKQTLAKAGHVYTDYDSQGRNVLRYVFNPDDETPAQFEITIRPLAAENYTYWAWRLDDPTDGTHKTLLDDDEIIISDTVKADNPYVFTVDYAEGAEVTVGGNASEGHAGWDLNVTATSSSAEPQTYAATVGPDAYTFTIPITQQQPEYANDEIEPIKAKWSYDGKAFTLGIDTVFSPGVRPDVEYTETRAFTPIPAEGYMFTGITLGNQELTAGDNGEIDTPDALVVTAHYAPIPELVQTSDDGNFWWLIALAVFAFAGIGYGLNRREKGIRR